MSTQTEKLMTAEEFMAKYGGCSGVELVRGRVVWAGQEPGQPTGDTRVPNFQHGVICRRAARILEDFVESRDLGWVASNDTFVPVGVDRDTVRGADVLYVSYGKVPKGKPPENLTVPPELVVEVRSPTDRWGDIQIKVGEYLNAGVGVVVILDPRTESVSVHRQAELHQLFHNGDEFTLPDVMPGFAVPVKRFFEYPR